MSAPEEDLGPAVEPDRERQIQNLQWLLGRVCAHIGMDPHSGKVDANRKLCEVNGIPVPPDDRCA